MPLTLTNLTEGGEKVVKLKHNERCLFLGVWNRDGDKTREF